MPTCTPLYNDICCLDRWLNRVNPPSETAPKPRNNVAAKGDWALASGTLLVGVLTRALWLGSLLALACHKTVVSVSRSE